MLIKFELSRARFFRYGFIYYKFLFIKQILMPNNIKINSIYGFKFGGENGEFSIDAFGVSSFLYIQRGVAEILLESSFNLFENENVKEYVVKVII